MGYWDDQRFRTGTFSSIQYFVSIELDLVINFKLMFQESGEIRWAYPVMAAIW